LAHAELAEFEQVWRTATDLDFSKTAELYELPFQRISSVDDFPATFNTALLQTGTRIIEILIDPEVSLSEHRSYWQSLASSLL
ncbi:MAG: 2-succinyl-5-enolpyruvyl-6-hydroxy-3-cyclohexene-1-carboxylate synthase, partial [Gammaproteobacteria bacterium]|nr:2-succinyl-5-enolpyruvyl-6-hydroxy-3-cyclohexene-1-carboxylate synthase [Gammaproteobacteria bacterium]